MARNERFHYLRMVGVEVFCNKQGKKEGGAAEAREGAATEEAETGQEDRGIQEEKSDVEQNGSSESKNNGAEDVSSTRD